MKFTKYILPLLAAGMLWSCSDDEWAKGAPTMVVAEDLGQACFGDSLRINVKASDPEVALSTLKAELFFGEELVSNTTVRTKVSGDNYEAAVYIPYLANIPDGRALLRLTLQNINFTTQELNYEVMITHPDYPELKFVADSGEEYVMERTSQYNYEFTANLPQEIKGKIVAPAMGDNGNELTFGYESSAIKVGAENSIPFSSAAAGNYTVSFNTFTFEGSPFSLVTINGNAMEGISSSQLQIDMNLSTGDKLVVSGLPEYDSYWIDSDWLSKSADGSLEFAAPSGEYRIIADMKLLYFWVYPISGGEGAKLNEDGSAGTIYVIGEGVGKPSVTANAVGWTTEKALAMVPLGNKQFRITFIGGQTIKNDGINFKFFSEMGWGGEFTNARLTTTSNLIAIGTGEEGHDPGNLYMLPGATFKNNNIYQFTIDLSAGIDAGVLTVENVGEVQFDEEAVNLNGEKMETADNEHYTLVANLTQGGTVKLDGVMTELWADPDYFEPQADGSYRFNAIDGAYKVQLDTKAGTLLAGGADATGTDAVLDPATGAGQIWALGDGLGHISVAAMPGWTPGAGIPLAQVAPGVYQFTGKAALPENAQPGDRFNATGADFKFFHQNGWGGEFGGDDSLTLTDGAAELIRQTSAGNFNLASQLEEGATYRITIDVPGRTIDMKKL